MRSHEQCYQFNTDLANVAKCLKEGHRTVILLRGVTGSGKTTLAEKLVEIPKSEGYACCSLSLDDIDANQLIKSVREAIGNDNVLIVIDAENIERSDIRRAVDVGINSAYEVYLVEPETTWKHDANECKRMSNRNEDIESIEEKINIIKTSPMEWNNMMSMKDVYVKICNHNEQDYSPLTPSGTPTASPTGSPGLSADKMTTKTSATSLPQMFSLAHVPKTKTVRTIGTSVTMECLAYELAGFPSTANCGFFPEKEETVPVNERNVRMIERKTDGEEIKYEDDRQSTFESVKLFSGSGKELDFAILTLLFPQVDCFDIRHQLQLMPYSEAFQLFLLTGEKTINPHKFYDNGVLWYELESDESYTIYSNMGIEEELEEMRKQRSDLHFDEDIVVSDETENDEQIARLLHDQINIEEVQVHPKDSYTYLVDRFYHTDKNMIREALEACAGNVHLARSCLIDQGQNEVKASARIKTWSEKASSPNPRHRPAQKKSTEEECNYFLNRKEKSSVALGTVQAEAMHIRRQLDSERSSRTSYNPSAGPQYHHTVMRERAARFKVSMTAAVKDIDGKIRDAHSNPYNLDLHCMSVEGAMDLVKHAIVAVRYHLRKSRAYKRMLIVTGSGNNSKNGAKIKPSIESILKKQGIQYELLNEGCIEVKIK